MTWRIRLAPRNDRVCTDFIGYENVKIVTFRQTKCRTHPYTILGIPVVTQIIDERAIFSIEDDEGKRIVLILRINGTYKHWPKERQQKQKHRYAHPSSLHQRVE